jgi:hypothetical protein
LIGEYDSSFVLGGGSGMTTVAFQGQGGGLAAGDWTSKSGKAAHPGHEIKAADDVRGLVWFRQGRLVIVSPDSLGTTCQLSGTTYRPVQISGTGSV